MEDKSRIGRWIDYRISKGVFVLGCCMSVVLTVAIGFFGGGWTTHDRAASMAAQAATDARLDLASAACVAQFLSQKDALNQQRILKNTEFWIRGQLITKGGWDKLPGQSSALNGVAGACAQRLAELPVGGDSKISDSQSGPLVKTTVE